MDAWDFVDAIPYLPPPPPVPSIFLGNTYCVCLWHVQYTCECTYVVYFGIHVCHFLRDITPEISTLCPCDDGYVLGRKAGPVKLAPIKFVAASFRSLLSHFFRTSFTRVYLSVFSSFL